MNDAHFCALKFFLINILWCFLNQINQFSTSKWESVPMVQMLLEQLHHSLQLLYTLHCQLYNEQRYKLERTGHKPVHSIPIASRSCSGRKSSDEMEKLCLPNQ